VAEIKIADTRKVYNVLIGFSMVCNLVVTV
jgi:hypothetical protein